MEHTLTFLKRLLMAALLVFATSFAPAPSLPSNAPVALRVTGFTSAMRDDLVRQAHVLGLQVEFACVPAGIILVTSTTGQARTALTEEVATVFRSRNQSISVQETNMTLEQAEQACANARNQ